MAYSFEQFITNERGTERGTACSLQPIRSSQTRDFPGHEKGMSQLSTLTANHFARSKQNKEKQKQM